MTEFDPCDACGVRSFVFVDMPGELTLSYCGAHFRGYEEKIREVAVTIVDLRHMIPTGRAGVGS